MAGHPATRKNGFIHKTIASLNCPGGLPVREALPQKPIGIQKEKELEDLTTEFNVKRRTLLHQAVHAEPGLVEAAAERIQAHIIHQRLEAHDTALIAYQKGGMVAVEINAILAAEFCQELLAPVVEAYEDEKARILE